MVNGSVMTATSVGLNVATVRVPQVYVLGEAAAEVWHLFGLEESAGVYVRSGRQDHAFSFLERLAQVVGLRLRAELLDDAEVLVSEDDFAR